MGAEEPLGQAGDGISMYIGYPGGGTGKLTIDPDRVDVFVRYMEQALDKLKEAYDRGRSLGHAFLGGDPFSPHALDDMRRTAGDDPGGHAYANRRAQEVFQAIIDNAMASLAAYRENEAQSTGRFQGDG